MSVSCGSLERVRYRKLGPDLSKLNRSLGDAGLPIRPQKTGELTARVISSVGEDLCGGYLSHPNSGYRGHPPTLPVCPGSKGQSTRAVRHMEGITEHTATLQLSQNGPAMTVWSFHMYCTHFKKRPTLGAESTVGA